MGRGDENSDEDGLMQRLAGIKSRIESACERSGRLSGEVTLVAVSKKQPVELLRVAVTAGQTVLGESQVQEAERKAAVLRGVDWHLIGPLQSNKARRAARLFDVVHSVDRLKIAAVLNREAAALGRQLDVFVQLNLGAEPRKHGFSPDDLHEAVEQLATFQALRIVGLMAIPPFDPEPERTRPWFQQLREHRDQVAQWLGGEVFPGWLSMGMSRDFEVAVEEGATHVRVGTEVFGERKPVS